VNDIGRNRFQKPGDMLKIFGWETGLKIKAISSHSIYCLFLWFRRSELLKHNLGFIPIDF
jgi:hypothetical protein